MNLARDNGSNFSEVIKSLSKECSPQTTRFYQISIVMRSNTGKRTRTRSTVVQACCAGAATKMVWDEVGPSTCAIAPEQFTMDAAIVIG